MSAEAVLRNVQAQPQVTFLVGTTPTDPNGNVATVTITRANGQLIGTADQATTRDSAGVYHVVLAPQADLDFLTLDWKGTFGTDVQIVRTLVEIIGAHFVPLSDLRAMQGLSSATNYPDQLLKEARYAFMDLAQEVCGQSFIPRYARDLLSGDGTKRVILSHRRPRKLISAKVDGSAVSDLSKWHLYSRGSLIRDDGSTFPVGFENVEVNYEHGATAPDWELRRAAKTAIRARLLAERSGIPSDAVSWTTDTGTLTRSTVGPTGIRDVDEALRRRAGSTALVV